MKLRRLGLLLFVGWFAAWPISQAALLSGGVCLAEQPAEPAEAQPADEDLAPPAPEESEAPQAPNDVPEPPAPEAPAQEAAPEVPSPPTDPPGAHPSLSDAPAPGGEPATEDDLYQLLRLFADTLDQVDRNYVRPVSRRELMEAAIRGMLEKLDPYSSYIAPEDLERFKSGVESEFGGIGIQVNVDAAGHLVIASPIYGGPAYRAGLLAGDRIVEIEGQSTKGITLEEAIRRLKGKQGTRVTLTVVHPGGPEQRQVTLQREIVRVQTVLGDLRKPDDHWNYFYDEQTKIGYLRLTTFARHTASELRAALEELTGQGMRGLVLDLRYNPGGLLSAAIEVSDLFIDEGRIVSTKGRNTPEHTWDAKQPGTFSGFPMAVLINHYSASASEIVSACLQDHGRAVVVGERSWGKGSVQNIIDLESGKSALKLTTAGYHRPSGKNIHRYEGAPESEEWGVSPDSGFEVKLAATEQQAYLQARRDRDVLRKLSEGAPHPSPLTDPQLAKALSWLAAELDKNLALGVEPPEPEQPAPAAAPTGAAAGGP